MPRPDFPPTSQELDFTIENSLKNAKATVLKFVSRAEQLGVRGMRNYNRYMLVNKGFVEADGPERRQWQKESSDESISDAQWNRRYGPLPGGAKILAWRPEQQQRKWHLTSAEGTIG